MVKTVYCFEDCCLIKVHCPPWPLLFLFYSNNNSSSINNITIIPVTGKLVNLLMPNAGCIITKCREILYVCLFKCNNSNDLFFLKYNYK